MQRVTNKTLLKHVNIKISHTQVNLLIDNIHIFVLVGDDSAILINESTNIMQNIETDLPKEGVVIVEVP